MSSEDCCARIDTLELKHLIIKKVGRPRSDKYFDNLRKWFSSRLTKNEFDMFCIKTIGKENIPLHNLLIKAIARNACSAKFPAPKDAKRTQRSSFQCLPPPSRRARTVVVRGRKPSPLGPSKPQQEKQQNTAELISLERTSIDNSEEVNQAGVSPGVQSRSPVTPPLGVFTSSSSRIRSSRKPTCLNARELPDTRSLLNSLQEHLNAEGINITLDCANMLNNAIDAYLKRLIAPCLGLSAARSQCFPATMVDFEVALGSNPRILGDDWPLKMEKVSSRRYGE